MLPSIWKQDATSQDLITKGEASMPKRASDKPMQKWKKFIHFHGYACPAPAASKQLLTEYKRVLNFYTRVGHILHKQKRHDKHIAKWSRKLDLSWTILASNICCCCCCMLLITSVSLDICVSGSEGDTRVASMGSWVMAASGVGARAGTEEGAVLARVSNSSSASPSMPLTRKAPGCTTQELLGPRSSCMGEEPGGSLPDGFLVLTDTQVRRQYQVHQCHQRELHQDKNDLAPLPLWVAIAHLSASLLFHCLCCPVSHVR